MGEDLEVCSGTVPCGSVGLWRGVALAAAGTRFIAAARWEGNEKETQALEKVHGTFPPLCILEKFASRPL